MEADGQVFTAGPALIRGGASRVRAFSESIGTEDSAGTWNYYYYYYYDYDRSALCAVVLACVS